MANEFSTGDPEIAFEMYMTNPVDIILSDWTHDLDGMAFLKKLRQDRVSHDPFVPVIVCTANTKMHHVKTAQDMGMTEFLAKPVSAKTIYSRICAVIESTRPFIRVSNFFGPDRRSRGDGYGGVERRMRPI